ncbi:hypothetical protein M8J76_007410 [Diaphorina citri]|nr:hypothetical protein M8J75_007531 [Diaphorina citri]KAI5723514.1 hypothetical protein M8J76_007410 [Diaphorina citri]
MAGTDKVMKELFESSDDKYSYNEHKTKDKRDDLYSPKVIMSDENSEQLPLKQLGEKVFGDTLNRDASKTYSSSESNASNEWKITNAFENKTDKVQTDNIENDTSKAQDDVVENITNNVATKDENNTHAIQRNVVENNKKDVLTNVEKNTNGFLTNVENNKHEVQANVVQNNTNKIQTNNFENNTNVKVKDEEIENVTESIKSIEPSTNMPIPVYSPSINYNFRYGYTNSPESQPLTTEYFTEIPGIFPTISNADIKNHRSRNAKQLLLPVNDIHSTFNYTKEQYEAIKAVNLDKIIYDLIMSKNSTKPSEEESKENSKGLDENVTVVNVSNETENFDLLESDGNETEHKSVVTVTSLPKVNTDQTNEDLKVDVIKNNTVIASNNTQSELLETGENKNDNNTFTTVIPTVKTSPTNDEFKLNLIKNIIRDKVRSRMRQYALNNSEPIVEEQLEATSIVRANSSEGQRKKRDVGENSYEDNENDIDSVNYSGEYFLDTDSVEEVNAITGRKESGNIELKEIGRIFNISDVTLHDSDLQSISDSIANGTALFFPNSTVKDKVLSCLLDFLRVVRILSTKCFNVSANGFDDNSIKCLRRTILKTMEKAVESDEIVVGYDLVLVKTNTGTPSDLDSKADRQIDSSTSWFGWYADLFRTLVRMFRTHTLKFRTEGRSFEVGTGRHRHYYKKVFPLVVGSYMIISAFLIPLGFQFMAMLGGKALLLSKLALMMGSIGIFKKGGYGGHYGGGYTDWSGLGLTGYGGFHKKNGQVYDQQLF